MERLFFNSGEMKRYLIVIFISIVVHLNGVAQNADDNDSAIVANGNKQAFKFYGTDNAKMLEMGEKMLEISKKGNLAVGAASSYNTIAVAYMAIGEYENSVQNFVEALRIYDSLNNKLDVANVQSNLGVVHFYLNEHAKSLEYHKKALEKRVEANDSVSISKSLNNIGIAFRNLGRNDSALEKYKQALAIKEKLVDQGGLANTLNNIGNIYLDKKAFNEALIYYQESYINEKELKRVAGQATSLNNIGLAKLNLGKYKAAEKDIRKAMALAESIDDKYNLLMSYKYLQQLFKLKGDFEQSLDWNEKWQELNDQLNDINKNKILKDIEAKYRNEKILAENENLKLQEQLKDELIFRRNVSLTLAILVVIFLLISLFMLLRSNRFKKSLLAIEQSKNDEITKKNELISEQRNELAEINASKNKMLAVLSHDIKGPVNNLISILDLANQGLLSNQELEDFLKQLTAETKNVKELISNILDWIKMQVGILEPKFEEFQIHSLVNEVIRIYSSSAEAKGLKIENAVDDQLMAMADPDLTKMIFRNLLNNAIKFSSEGSIRIKSHIQSTMIFISVVDSGVGIDQEGIAKMFSDEQYTTAGTDDELGTGIGLLLVKEFVYKNGGKLTASSEVGVGSTFTFSLKKSG